MASDIIVNTRCLMSPSTGVQRYARELSDHLADHIECCAPERSLTGLVGHLWEQIVLPGKLRGRLLWSPANVGPVAVERQVVTIHDLSPIDHPEWFTPLFSRWYAYLLPRLIARSRKIITVSEFTKQRVLETSAIASAKVAVIPNGVSPKMKPQPLQSIAAMRRYFGLPDAMYFLSLSSLEPRKNLDRLLRAWGRLHTIAGEGPYLVIAGATGASRVFRSARLGTDISPNVIFVGSVPEYLLPPLISGATGFIYLSLYEGFGLPVLEAMACGTPVLASRIPPIQEVVDGAALLVDPDNDEAVQEGLKTFLSDQVMRSHLSEIGLRRSAAFSWSTTANSTLKVLKECL